MNTKDSPSMNAIVDEAFFAGIECAAKVVEEFDQYTGAHNCDITDPNKWDAATAHDYGRGASEAKHMIAAHLRGTIARALALLEIVKDKE